MSADFDDPYERAAELAHMDYKRAERADDAAETARIYGTMLDHAMDGIDRRDALLAAMTAELSQVQAENARLKREIEGVLEEQWQAECYDAGRWS